MRSQIACAHCRRSKVKCVNTGTDSVCKACQNQNRECTYPEAGSSGPRRESIVDRTGDTPRVKREKKRAAPSSQPLYPNKKQTSPPHGDNPLDPRILTPQVWNELFEIFQQHYATDFPFLHAPTFRNEVQQLPPLFQLSFLTLTARFHPTLRDRHGNDQVQAAEYYAKAAHLCQNTLGLLGEPTLKTIQAQLMLGLHEWGMTRGATAWGLVGMAIRTAQRLGLHSERHLDDRPGAFSSSSLGVSKPGAHSKPDEVIENEIRRRTFWSCFILDRYLSFNHFQTQMLHINDIRVQLPCSDHSFIFGHEVDTGMLEEGEDAARARFKKQNVLRRMTTQAMQENRTHVNGTYGQETGGFANEPKQEIGETEWILSRFIKAMHLYGQVMRYSCTGGRRRREEIDKAPWEDDSTWATLEKKLKSFKDTLPRDLILNPSNTRAHIENKTSRHYTLMHAGHLLCSITLYREYMAFLPFSLHEPIGPLDAPKIPKHKVPPNKNYWRNQASNCFGAARSLVDLLHTCQEANLLVETPLAGFATWQAVHCGIYCSFFPKMDVDSAMSVKRSRSANGEEVEIDRSGHVAYRRSWEMLKRMSARLVMARVWGNVMIKVRTVIENTRKKREASGDVLDNGGLKEWEEIEMEIQQFGDCQRDYGIDEEVNFPDFSSEPKDHEEPNESDGAVLKRENWDTDRKPLADTTPKSASTGFTAVNDNRPSALKSAAGTTTAAVTNGAQYPFESPVASHTAQENTSSTSSGYHAYGYQYSAPSYAPITAESAQRASLNTHQHAPNQGPSTQFARHSLQYSQAIPDSARNMSWQMGSDLSAFAGGYGEKEALETISCTWGGERGPYELSFYQSYV